MKMISWRSGVLAVLLVAGLQARTAPANNLRVTNVVLSAGDAGYTYVQFDISWENSWRASWVETGLTPNITVTNWDAAWVFVKYRFQAGDWQHASLSITNAAHVAPAGSVINVGLSTNAGGTNFGCGVFLYRAAEGCSSWTNTGVKLRWNYAQDGVATTARVDVCVNGIEMVYVPQGSFYVGSGGTESGSFTEGSWSSGATIPLQITGESALTIANTAGNLWGASSSGNNTIGSAGVLPADYPKGYKAFYCMKYEISQGEWVSFFNLLTDTQKSTRDITGGTYNSTGKETDLATNSNTVAWSSGDAACTTPERACNFLGWADDAAYADWAGLRPMTELEFEKACRGPVMPVANEYAWGNAITPVAITNCSGGADGSGMETALPANANCCYNNRPEVQGPVRCGIFATPVSARADAGATYWGIMEMSGNLWERTVTVADAGRTFTGTVGDGKLAATTGNANADFWPSASGSGTGFRGGVWDTASGSLRTSDRLNAALVLGIRGNAGGFRAVRQASSVVP